MIPVFPSHNSINKKGVIVMATPKVDMELCIGCGLCTELCPKVFELRDDKAWVVNPNGCDTCDCRQAVDSCPVTAIALE
jgi:ferredoxin